MRTIADHWDARETSGFNYLRLALAVGVVLWHTTSIDYGTAAIDAQWSSWLRIPGGAILPMFFSLGGFLVAGSLERTRLDGFLTLRAMRLLPAMAVEVVLSAFILGFALTTQPFTAYFGSPKFWSYLWNAACWPHYYLPGVFDHNPRHEVNAQLWTVPFDIECYFILAIASVIGLVKRPKLFAFVTLALNIMFPLIDALAGKPLSGAFMPGPLLVVSFLAGVSLFLLRERIPLRGLIAALAFSASVVLLASPLGMPFSPIPIAYVTVWLGVSRLPKLSIGGDYSYGIFLFGFPIQQAIANFPELRDRWLSLAIALPAVAACAVLSWLLVERPILGHRRIIVAAVQGGVDHLVWHITSRLRGKRLTSADAQQ